MWKFARWYRTACCNMLRYYRRAVDTSQELQTPLSSLQMIMLYLLFILIPAVAMAMAAITLSWFHHCILISCMQMVMSNCPKPLSMIYDKATGEWSQYGGSHCCIRSQWLRSHLFQGVNHASTLTRLYIYNTLNCCLTAIYTCTWIYHGSIPRVSSLRFL